MRFSKTFCFIFHILDKINPPLGLTLPYFFAVIDWITLNPFETLNPLYWAFSFYTQATFHTNTIYNFFHFSTAIYLTLLLDSFICQNITLALNFIYLWLLLFFLLLPLLTSSLILVFSCLLLVFIFLLLHTLPSFFNMA